MRYDISKATVPAMPNLGKDTECVKLLLTQASKDMYVTMYRDSEVRYLRFRG